MGCWHSWDGLRRCQQCPWWGGMCTRDSSGAQGGACRGGETEAQGCNPNMTQPFIPVRLRSPVMAREGLILHCLGAVHCFARASVYLGNGLSPAWPCSVSHQGAFALYIRVTSSLRASLMGKLRHRGVVEKTRSSGPGERLCSEDTRLRAAPNPWEQGWDCCVAQRDGIWTEPCRITTFSLS